MNKKAQVSGMDISSNLIYALIVLTLFSIGLIVLATTIGQYHGGRTDVNKEIRFLYMEQLFLNSKDCFVYEDKDIQQVYPEVIDKSKFTNNRLKQCYDAKNVNVAIRLKLLDLENKVVGQVTQNMGIGGENKITQAPITIYDGTDFKQGTMFIEVWFR